VARYIIVALSSGVLFGVLDALINANPLAQGLLAPFSSIAREKVNVIAGVFIDLIYGFVMAGIFLLIYPGLPGPTPIIRGLSYGIIAWFFRVLMSVLSQWVMFDLPIGAILYLGFAGLIEMMVLGLLYGAFLKP
jgi:hypothetical protein